MPTILKQNQLLLIQNLVVLLVIGAWTPVAACTTAVVSGRVTSDGRPLLWKNRDTTVTRRNEVIIFQGEKYQVMAVVNAGERKTVWMGVNSAGFCIENSLSKDLSNDEKNSGPGNGTLMRIALETCATVDDFSKLLEKTNQSGRSTVANFGVIDAAGGAAMFEASPTSFRMFDANDPVIAPNGYIVRSNFATTAQKLSANPTTSEVEQIYSGERYSKACQLLESRLDQGISLSYVIRNLTRDLSDKKGVAYAGTVNGGNGETPTQIDTTNTISRTTTVSTAVFHGVRPGEPPQTTTMWTILGDPKFSIAVPCWLESGEISTALSGEHGGEICSIANTMRDWIRTDDRTGVFSAPLNQIWKDLWPIEDQMISSVLRARTRWEKSEVTPAEFRGLHLEIADQALKAMQIELSELKETALKLPSPAPPTFAPFSKTILVP